MPAIARRLVVPLLIGAFVCMTASLAQAAFPGQNGKLVIDGYAIETFNPDGSNLTALASGRSPAWSPDGKQIAYISGSDDVYVMDQNGLNQRQVTNNIAPHYQPAWSPDGQKIVFVNYGTQGDVTGAMADLYVVRIDGTGQTNLTNTPAVSEVEPAWSADGKIAFVSENNISVMNGDGTGRTQLTDFAPDGLQPADPNWSPDSKRLVYGLGASSVPGENPYDYKLQVINADGSGVTNYFACCKGPSDPAWSPDGRYIVENDLFSTGLFILEVASRRDTSVPSPERGILQGAPDWQPSPLPPKRGDYRSSAQFCKALRAFLGDADFSKRYKNHGMCASAS
jgi:Tol biopolymer transport system component